MPITIIPLLYKVFAKLLYNRLLPILDKEQCADQAGFRPRFSTLDHLATFVILSEKADEFQLPIWVAALDFKKAFDTIDHDKLWASLLSQHVPDA